MKRITFYADRYTRRGRVRVTRNNQPVPAKLADVPTLRPASIITLYL